MEKKILIVEDIEDLNDLYEIVFEKHGYKVAIAKNGQEALDIVASFNPDFVLLDIMMPEMNWFEFLKRFNDEVLDIDIDQKMIIAVHSNLSQDSDIKKSFELWADYYFKKSDFTPFSLVEKVNAILDSETELTK